MSKSFSSNIEKRNFFVEFDGPFENRRSYEKKISLSCADLKAKVELFGGRIFKIYKSSYIPVNVGISFQETKEYGIIFCTISVFLNTSAVVLLDSYIQLSRSCKIYNVTYDHNVDDNLKRILINICENPNGSALSPTKNVPYSTRPGSRFYRPSGNISAWDLQQRLIQNAISLDPPKALAPGRFSGSSLLACEPAATELSKINDGKSRIAYQLQSYGVTLFKSDKFSDITINVQGNKFPAHRVILAAMSPVFEAMFSGNFKENTTKEVEIENFSLKTVTEMVCFIYTGEMPSFESDLYVRDLYAVSDCYDVKELKSLCVQELLSTLNVDNALDVLLFAEMHNDDQLKKSVLTFICKNPSSVSDKKKCAQIIKMRPELLEDVLECKFN